MLVLTRRIGEEIVIDDHIRLVVVAIRGERVCLGFRAPESVPVNRQEVHERQTREPCSGSVASKESRSEGGIPRDDGGGFRNRGIT